MKVKKWLICAVLLLLAAGWSWRYVTLNAFYDGIYEDRRITYKAGEVVPFGDDREEQGVSADGYSIRVDGFAVMDVPEFLKSIGVSEEEVFSRPDRVAVVYATLFNEGSQAPGITLTDFTLHGVDNYAAVDWELLSAANPVLREGSYGISLSPGKEYPIILPFALYEQYFGADTWRHLERRDFTLHATDYPTEKDIACR